MAGEGVLERLEKEVANHSLGLRSQHVEGVGVGKRGVARALKREQPDLRPITVGDDHIVVAGQRGQCLHRSQNVFLLDLGEWCLPALQQRVSSQSYNEPHFSRPSWPPWPP